MDDETNPFFVLTTNDAGSGGRDLSPMIVSRCTPLFLRYLPASLEQKVLAKKCVLEVNEAGRLAQFFYTIRGQKYRLPPSTREAIATANALRKTGLEVTEHNCLRLNCHWIKNPLDYQALRDKYIFKDAGVEKWKDKL